MFRAKLGTFISRRYSQCSPYRMFTRENKKAPRTYVCYCLLVFKSMKTRGGAAARRDTESRVCRDNPTFIFNYLITILKQRKADES